MKTQRRLSGRRALITGAASGIGEETARYFLAEGAQVALLDRNEAGLSRLSGEVGSIAIPCDLAQPDSVQKAVTSAVRALGGLDAVVNAAGILTRKPFEDIDVEEWQRLFEINLRGPALVCKYALPGLRSCASATIVNIASMSALKPSPGTSAYAASKGGLLMLGKCLAEELAPKIRVNTICPGIVDTPMTAGFMADPAVRAQIERSNVLHRSGSPADIASAAVFLTSDESAFMTGTQLVIDGGMSFY
jgi:NAD(P)-dependent dehydrogenase (short-subunit alcohol dehydrogenase family)